MSDFNFKGISSLIVEYDVPTDIFPIGSNNPIAEKLIPEFYKDAIIIMFQFTL